MQSSAAKTVLNRYDLGSHLIGWQIISNFRFWHKADNHDSSILCHKMSIHILTNAF
ncbi:hypothetical protein ECDEC9B_5442 [Escherichia coli DEC9B]|nr:hypothetical protein ECDEC9B_5442 [Escherichia coli DEC9B]